MPEFTTEIRESYDKKYLKVQLKDNSRIEEVQKLLSNLQSVRRVNITENTRTDLTLYPGNFFDITEMDTEVKIQLSNFFTGRPMDPIILNDKIDSISDKAFEQIVNEINIFGKNLEKYKRLYDKFGEEGFRDFFLPHLNSISKSHSATGETFNKKGKTDILIQDQEGHIVFLAECKLWKGESELTKAIDQLFTGYVNWRDDKVAIIIFNKDVKKFSELIDKAKNTIESHEKYVSLIKARNETSILYEFKNPEDDDKKVKLELILFNCS